MSILNTFDLTGKTAIVTGGGRGLGKGIAEGLCEAGASVVIIGSSNSVINTAKEFTDKGFIAYAIKGDLSNKELIPTIFNEALSKLNGKIDILINNAGIQRRHKCEEFPLSDWETVLAGNVMLKQGHGKIINLASMLSFFGGYTVPAYAASKGAVAQLTKALANEWANKNINVNAIAPGYMNTEMNVNLVNDTNRNQEILNRIPAGRWGTPNDMKGLAIFLSSSASNYINGAIIPVDGGYLSR